MTPPGMAPHRIAIQTDGRLVQGNERQIELIARGLIARGHTVYISARPQSPAWDFFAATGAAMTDARPRGVADVPSALRFRRWLRHIRPDALLFTSWRRLWIGALVARSAGVPNTVMRFGGTHDIPHGLRGAHYRSALLDLVDRIYVNSTFVRDHLLNALPALGASRVHIIWNGIPAATPEPAPIRAQLAVPPDASLVAAVGGLSRVKGFDVLIRALAAADVNSHLVICGEGGERDRLSALARVEGVADRVHLAGQRADVSGILGAADAFVLSSRREGFSVALLEAMRAGLPIIATDVGGARDALSDEAGNERAGWIVPPDDVAALAATLRDVLGSLDAAATRARAAEAERRVRYDYTVERMVHGVERVLLTAPPHDG